LPHRWETEEAACIPDTARSGHPAQKGSGPYRATPAQLARPIRTRASVLQFRIGISLLRSVRLRLPLLHDRPAPVPLIVFFSSVSISPSSAGPEPFLRWRNPARRAIIVHCPARDLATCDVLEYRSIQTLLNFLFCG
jgi:hypothetical protein